MRVLILVCPLCRRTLVSPRIVGQKRYCRECGQTFTVSARVELPAAKPMTFPSYASGISGRFIPAQQQEVVETFRVGSKKFRTCGRQARLRRFLEDVVAYHGSARAISESSLVRFRDDFRDRLSRFVDDVQPADHSRKAPTSSADLPQDLSVFGGCPPKSAWFIGKVLQRIRCLVLKGSPSKVIDIRSRLPG